MEEMHVLCLADLATSYTAAPSLSAPSPLGERDVTACLLALYTYDDNYEQCRVQDWRSCIEACLVHPDPYLPAKPLRALLGAMAPPDVSAFVYSGYVMANEVQGGSEGGIAPESRFQGRFSPDPPTDMVFTADVAETSSQLDVLDSHPRFDSEFHIAGLSRADAWTNEVRQRWLDWPDVASAPFLPRHPSSCPSSAHLLMSVGDSSQEEDALLLFAPPPMDWEAVWRLVQSVFSSPCILARPPRRDLMGWYRDGLNLAQLEPIHEPAAVRRARLKLAVRNLAKQENLEARERA